jgi:hypothetical protein
MRASTFFYRGMFNSEPVILPKEITCKKDLAADTPFHEKLKTFMKDGDMLSEEIIVEGQQYKTNDLVVLKVEDCDVLKVGLIQAILIKNGKVFFVCRVYTCMRSWLQFFESKNCDEFCSFVESGRIADYKPLIKRGTTVKFQFVLHHRVSFSYHDK